MTSDRKQLLPIHFLSQTEAGNEEVILQQWLDVCATGKKKFLVKYQNNNSYVLLNKINATCGLSLPHNDMCFQTDKMSV